MKKYILLLLCLTLIFTGCSKQEQNKQNEEKPKDKVEQKSQEDGEFTITDVLGREVKFEKMPQTAICLGASSLRIVSYLGAVDKIVGVEDLERKNTVICCYRYVNFDLIKDLPIIGQGGSGGSTPFEEEIIKLSPDVILATYPSEKADELENKLGIPVVALKMQDDFTDPKLIESLKTAGKVLGKEERAEEVVDFIQKAVKDLNERTKDYSKEKPTVYPAAVSFRGGHGLEGTFSNFAPLKAINAVNISDKDDMVSGYDMDLENVVAKNPDYIFLTSSNMNLVEEQYKTKPEIFDSLDAFKEGRVYTILPYNWYATNMELAIADAYYMGKILYPEEFKDIDIAKKTDELTTGLLGVPLYEELVKSGNEFKEVKMK